MEASATFAELVTALWPVLAAIAGAFAYGIYVWANTRRDASEALKLGEQNRDEIAKLNTKHEQHAERLAALEARQNEIAENLRWMRANWWLPYRRNKHK